MMPRQEYSTADTRPRTRSGCPLMAVGHVRDTCFGFKLPGPTQPLIVSCRMVGPILTSNNVNSADKSPFQNFLPVLQRVYWRVDYDMIFIFVHFPHNSQDRNPVANFFFSDNKLVSNFQTNATITLWNPVSIRSQNTLVG